MKFNINETVKVRLTDRGHEILKELHDDLYSRLPKSTTMRREYIAEEDADGYTKFQMHDLMSTFGYHVSLGSSLPFETDIIL